MVGLSLAEQRFIQGGIAQNLRSDGRGREDFRSFSIESGVIPQANGSARVRIGSTDVIATLKADLGKPSPYRPDQGKVEISIECSSIAAPEFERRGGDELSMELSGALQRSLLGGKSGAGNYRRRRRGEALLNGINEMGYYLSSFIWSTGAGIDLSNLKVVEGKFCWDLYIEGLVLSSDGNLLDALAMAIKAALSNTCIPKVEVRPGSSAEQQEDVDISDEEFSHLDTSGVPVIVTLTKVGMAYIVDATLEEESQMSSAVSVSINKLGRVCGLTKRGGAGLDPSVVLAMISVAKHVGQRLITLVDSEIVAAEARMADDQL